jgi:hypothetical protein
LPDPLPDVTQTWECYGETGWENNKYVSQGWALLTPRVFAIFRKLKIRKTIFEPVQIIED